MTTVDEASDIVAITRLRARYAWAYDEADVDTALSLFTPTPNVDLGSWGAWHSADELRVGLRDQMVRGRTLHILGSMIVDVDGDRATARMYTNVYHPPKEYDHPIRFVGRYFDEYERISGQWRIASIRLEQYWFAGY